MTKTVAEELGFTSKTRDSTIVKKLREAGWSEDKIKSYLRGWNVFKEIYHVKSIQ